MTREQAKELQEAFNHFAEGGKLWSYDYSHWFKQQGIISDGSAMETDNIIEDKHFEARKAHALGETIQVRQGNDFSDIRVPLWEQREGSEYRPKPKEPIYFYRYEKLNDEGQIFESNFVTDEFAKKYNFKSRGWSKILNSKRLRLTNDT